MRLSLAYQQSGARANRHRQVPTWSFWSIAKVIEKQMKKTPGNFRGPKRCFSTWARVGSQTVPSRRHVGQRQPSYADDSRDEGQGDHRQPWRYDYDRGSVQDSQRACTQGRLPRSAYLRGCGNVGPLEHFGEKRPMELCKLNSSRLPQSTLLVKIAKYYFGDISDATSSCILITERILFGDVEPVQFARNSVGRRPPVAVFVVESPRPCDTYTEYYLALVRRRVRMAGSAVLAGHFEDWSNRPLEAFGCTAECAVRSSRRRSTRQLPS